MTLTDNLNSTVLFSSKSPLVISQCRNCLTIENKIEEREIGKKQNSKHPPTR